MPKFLVEADLVPSTADDANCVRDQVLLNRFGEHTRNYKEAAMRLRDALLLVQPDQDAGTHWTESQPYFEDDWFDYEYRRLVPPVNITPASYRRVTRLLQKIRREGVL